MTNDMTPELTLEPTATATELPNLTLTPEAPEVPQVEEKKVVVKEKKETDEFDFSDIQATPKEVTSEDIIAASMAEAYKE